MRTRSASWLRVALVSWLLGDEEPLAGDLVEECPYRSRTWFWRQLTFAVLARVASGAWATLRSPARLVEPLASVGMVILLCFQAIVAGGLLARLLALPRLDHPQWLTLVVLLWFPVACGIGKGMSRLRERSRPWTVLLCGGTAAVAALLTQSVLSSSAPLFFPAVGYQAAAAFVFVVGLRVGAAESGRRARV